MVKGVDFKSVTSSGSGGVIVVAPSSGKTWLSPLTRETLIEIPVDLLRAVSVGRKVPSGFKFFFSDLAENVEDVVVETNATNATNADLCDLEYFEPFLEAEGFSPDLVPVPCTRAEFLALLEMRRNVAATSIYGMKAVHASLIGGALHTADKLGDTTLAEMRARAVSSALYYHDLGPDFAAAMEADSAGEIVDLTEDVYGMDAVEFAQETRLFPGKV